MKRLRYLLIIVSIECLVIGCKKDDENFIPTPSITTLIAEVPNDGGVIFSGELTHPDKITNHGFYYSEDSLFRNVNYVQISLNEPKRTGEFEAIIETGLKKNTVYFFKAFITVEDDEYFGVTKPFFSSGSKPPIIDFIIPEKAHLEDTISIHGRYFGQNSYYTTVHFNEIRAKIVSRSDSAITCIVPGALDDYISTIMVTAFDKSDSADYSLHTPIIEGFSPAIATFRDTISIFGNHFDNLKIRNNVELNDFPTEIINSSRTQIDFVIPDELNDSLSIINLFSQVQWVESNDKLKLLPPKIDSIPLCTYTNQNIQIKGEFFHPNLYKNKVFIENIEAEVISGNVNSLIIKVPQGPFPRGQANISIQVANYDIKSKRDFCISDTWLMISNTLPFSFYGDVGTFTISNQAYVVSDPNDFNDSEIALWKFNESTNDWTKYETPFLINHDGTCTSNNIKGYLYNTGDNDNFWEYNPISNDWSQKADFPGESRKQATSFSIGDDIYVGSGVYYDFNNQIAYCDFYKYTPSSDSWTKVSSLPVDYCYKRYRASTFVIDDIAYLTAGASNTGMNDTWKYIPSIDEWIQVANFTDARRYTSSFSLNDKGYIANGTPVGGSARKECWEYDPLTNSWSKFDDIGHKARYRGFAFTVSDTAYVGGGSGYNGAQYEIFKLVK